MPGRRPFLVILIFAAVACGIAIALFGPWHADEVRTPETPAEKPQDRLIADAGTNGTVRGFPGWRKKGAWKPDPKKLVAASADVSDSEFTATERKTVDRIQSALDDDDLGKLKEELGAASASTNAAVRTKAVEALNWFGNKALPELTPFLADSDEEVSSAAMDAVVQALNVAEDKEKLTYIESILSVKGACSKDGVTMLCGELNGLQDEVGAMAAIVRIIADDLNPEANDALKESYKFITGEDYTTVEAAQKWIDEKNTPPDPE